MAFKMGHMLNSGSFGQIVPGGPYSANKWREDGYKLAADASGHLHTHGHADSETVMTGPTPAYPWTQFENYLFDLESLSWNRLILNKKIFSYCKELKFILIEIVKSVTESRFFDVKVLLGIQ